jgi:hypothetical protein
VRYRQTTELDGGRDVESNPLEPRPGHSVKHSFAKKASLPGHQLEIPDNEILGDALMRKEIEFLKNDADPIALRIKRGLWVVGTTLEFHTAGIGLDNACCRGAL